jgi:hypothetical protein
VKKEIILKKMKIAIFCLLTMVVAAGCASTNVTSRERLVYGQLPRPDHIWVYDFASTPADVPADSALAGQYAENETPQTEDEIATGRKLGSEISGELVEEIRSMGMPAEHGWSGTTPQINDIVIRGYLLSVKKGDVARRVIVGLGSGSSELSTAVEVFQMTDHGLRKLGFGTLESAGGKTPGGAVGVATLLATHNPAGLIVSSGVKVYGEKSGKSTVEGRAKQTAHEIADVLKKRMQEQGWIN